PWTERGEGAATVGTHADLQPAIGPGKLVAEVERDSEQAVARGDGGRRDCAALLSWAAHRVIQRKRQIIAAVGWISVVVEAALKSKGRRLCLGLPYGCEGDRYRQIKGF